MPAAAIKVIFHIGLERTGTTSFQQFCTRHARQLARQSVLYPVKCLAFAKLNHAPLAASYLNPQRPPDFYLQTRHTRDLLLKSLRKEIEGSGAKTVIISSEHFSSRFRLQETAALAHDFSDYDCKVVVVIRDHFRRFLSSYSVHIMSGAVQNARRIRRDDFAAQQFISEICRNDFSVGTVVWKSQSHRTRLWPRQGYDKFDI